MTSQESFKGIGPYGPESIEPSQVDRFLAPTEGSSTEPSLGAAQLNVELPNGEPTIPDNIIRGEE